MTAQTTEAVLVPIDGSPLSYRALRHALETFPDASVTALHVIDLFQSDRGGDTGSGSTYEPPIGSEAWYTQAEKTSERILEEAEAIAEDRDREITTVSEVGDPKRIIMDFADEANVDHVVVGTHGRVGEDRLVYGSTADAVARRSPVPVTLVR